MAVPEYAADQPHIDNILQNMALPQETAAADVVAKINEHMASKSGG